MVSVILYLVVLFTIVRILSFKSKIQPLSHGTDVHTFDFGMRRVTHLVSPPTGREAKIALAARLLSMLLVLLALVIAVAAIMAGLSLKVWAFIPPGLYGRVAYWALLLAGTVATIFGLFGLVNARLSDRRWCSLYIMGLTILAECVFVLALLVNMSLDTASAGWWVPYVTNLGVMGIVGLIGVGISLC